MTDLDPIELDILRRLSPAAKLAVMHRLIQDAYRLKIASIRAAAPALSETEVLALARAHVAGDRS